MHWDRPEGTGLGMDGALVGYLRIWDSNRCCETTLPLAFHGSTFLLSGPRLRVLSTRLGYGYIHRERPGFQQINLVSELNFLSLTTRSRILVSKDFNVVLAICVQCGVAC